MNVLFKITKHGFYSGVEFEKYIVVSDIKIKNWLNALLLIEYGNKDYTDIINKVISEHYFRGEVTSGLGDLEISNLGIIALHI